MAGRNSLQVSGSHVASRANLQGAGKASLNKNFSNMIGDQGQSDLVKQASMPRVSSEVPTKDECYVEDGDRSNRVLEAPSHISEDMWGELPKY